MAGPTKALTFPKMIVILIALIAAGYAVQPKRWQHLGWGLAKSPAQYRDLRQAHAFRGLPIDALTEALNRRLSPLEPIALESHLWSDPFLHQRLCEGLYPRPVVPRAAHQLALAPGGDDPLVLWPEHGAFVLRGPNTTIPAHQTSAPDPAPPLDANPFVLGINVLACLGLGWLTATRRAPWVRKIVFHDDDGAATHLATAGLQGAVIIGVVASVATWLQWPFATSILRALGIAGALGFCAIRMAQGAHRNLRALFTDRDAVAIGTMTLASALLAAFCARVPISGWDGRSIWLFRAHQMIHAGNFSLVDATNNAYEFSNPVYPLFFPAWLSFFSGSGVFDERQAALAMAPLLGMQAIALLALLRPRLGRAGALVLAGLFFFAAWPRVATAYPDMFVTGFLLIAVFAMSDPLRASMAPAALLGAALCKREGFVLALVAWVVIGVVNATVTTRDVVDTDNNDNARPPRWRRWLSAMPFATFAVFIPPIFHALWARQNALPEVYQDLVFAGPAESLERLATMARAFLNSIPDKPIFAAAPIAAVMLLARGSKSQAGAGRAIGVIALAAFAFTVVVFVTTPFAFSWHMSLAFGRVVEHGCWLSLAALIVHGCPPKEIPASLAT